MAISKKHFLENWRFWVIIARKVHVNKLQSPFFSKKFATKKESDQPFFGEILHK
jgi:hypothetical protein